ncbi:MAG TPA: hypothetical protein VJ045_11915 [Hyphomicrobiaceae bacterium]|nr:hypothetical protein [Hyphomicrobiaceae bacterium]
MKSTTIMGFGAALALASSSAMAFQEQKAGEVPSPQVTPAPAPSDAPKDLGFATPESAKGSAQGTEVRIPGLGKLGVLPKMDFGLELLYGASEGKQPEAEREAPADDLTIRGTVKHNF